MKVRDVAAIIEDYAPVALQEEYDNCGLNVGNYDDEVTGVLLCVDVTEAVLEEAVSKGANMIISHHPLLFHPLKCLTDSDAAQRITRRALIAGISLYAAHTNLDSTVGGMSHFLGHKLGLKGMSVLAPHSEGSVTGYGVLGELYVPMGAVEFLEFVRRELRCGCIRHSELCRSEVSFVALSTGSGGSFIRSAMARGADIFISADFRYNDFFIPDSKLIVADVGHFESEYCAIDLLFDIITKKISTFAVHKSVNSVNPVNYLV